MRKRGRSIPFDCLGYAMMAVTYIIAGWTGLAIALIFLVYGGVGTLLNQYRSKGLKWGDPL